MEITLKLKSLRTRMKECGLDAYVITGADPHGSEYPPESWRTRRWISGFTGSAGTVALTSDRAGLWTDFRYWIQAADELSGSGIELFREGAEGVKILPEYLAASLPAGSVVGIDGRSITEKTACEWEGIFQRAGIVLKDDADLIDGLWNDRPGLPEAQVTELDADISGESRKEKISRLKKALTLAGADVWIGTGLDSAAWLLNVRGADVPYNPVVVGYLLLLPERLTWFTVLERIPHKVRDSLLKDGIGLEPYESFYEELSCIPSELRILADTASLSRTLMKSLPKGAVLRMGADPVVSMKAVKNAVEIRRISGAMEKDGAAMVRFLIRLKRKIADGASLTEIEAADLLRSCRAEMPGYLGDSFSYIPAFQSHGAICHYEAKEEGAFVLKSGSDLFLIDSGGQWDDGTTDITRTVSLGIPSSRQRDDYTLVLKAHITVAAARFPQGTRGYQIDALARGGLWRRGLDYGHGTGHGIGYRLNVHEGPQKLSPHPIDVALVPGMIVSDEPGLYREGEYGIRIENLVLCGEMEKTAFGTFLGFKTLTLAPYDRTLIDIGMLEEDEISWIDAYHDEVYTRLKSLLNKDESEWLYEATRPLIESV